MLFLALITTKECVEECVQTNQINLGVEITESKYIVRTSRFGERLSSLIINGIVHLAVVTQSIKDFKLLNEAEK